MVSQDQMDIVSSEIVSAIHQIIVNGAALIACTQRSESTPPFFYFLFFIFYFLFFILKMLWHEYYGYISSK